MNPKQVGSRVAFGLSCVLGGLAACSDSDRAATTGNTAATEPIAATPAVKDPSPTFALEFERDVSIRYRGTGAPLTFRTSSNGTSTSANLGQWLAHAQLDIAPLMTNDKDCHTRPLHVAAWGATAATEVWCDRGRTVEHAYQFTKRPKTHDLLIEVEVRGVRRGVQLADRVRLDTRAGIAMNYGKAAWLDANGVRHPVELEWQAAEAGDGGKLSLRVSAEALDKSAYPAVLDPELNAWTAVAEPVYVPSNSFTSIPFASAPLGDDVAVFFHDEWVRLRADGSVAPPAASPVGSPGFYWRARGAPFGTYFVRPGTLFRLGKSGVWLGSGFQFTTLSDFPLSVNRRSDGNLVLITRDALSADRTIFSTDGTVLEQAQVPRADFVTDLDGSTVRHFNNAGSMLVVTDVDITTSNVLRTTSVPYLDSPLIVTLSGARSIVAMDNNVLQFDAALSSSSLDLPSGLQAMKIAAAGDVACVLVNDNTGYALAQISLSANQHVATHPVITNGSEFGGTFSTRAGGFVVTTQNGEATLLDTNCAPTHAPIQLVTVPQTQYWAGIVKSTTDSWALWRDGRDSQSSLYARQLNATNGSPIGTDVQGTLVVDLPDGTHIASVTNDDRSVVTVHNTGSGNVSTLAFDGGPLPAPQVLGQATWTNIVPLLNTGGDVRLVGRRVTDCTSPPCASELVFGDGTDPQVVLASGARDYTNVVSASRGADHWVLTRAELQNNATQVRALSVDFATGAVGVDVLLAETSSATVQLAGIAIDQAGIPAAVWSESQFGGSSTYYFATVNQGVVVPGGQGPWPGGAHLTSLDQQRGYVAGGLLLDRNGNTMLEIATPDVQQGVAAMTAEPGHVIVGVNERDPSTPFNDESSLIYTAYLFVGEADGNSCANDGECGSGFCQEGACCERKCGICERCDGGTPGKCAPAINTDDDSCFGDRSCDEAGACKPANGETCMVDTDCSSGFCVDGVCCDSACDDPCGSCQPGVGVCTLVECGAYGCAGAGECKQLCESTVDCAADFVCGADERCITPTAASPEEEGCGCRVVGVVPSNRRRDAGWILLLGLALAIRRRRPQLS